MAKKKQWNLVDSRFAYLNWLYERNYTGNDIESYDIKMKMANWYLKSYSLRRLDEPAIDLISSYLAYEHALKIATENFGDNKSRIVGPIQGLLLANYLMATTRLNNSQIEIHSDGEVTKKVTPLAAQINYLKSKSHKVGLSLIEKEIEFYLNLEEIDHLLITKAKLKLADWYLMYGKRERAIGHYHAAYEYFKKNSDNTELVNDLFSQPVFLPNFSNVDNRINILSESSTLQTSANYVHASMDVTRYGTAKNVKVVSSNPTNNAMRSKVIRSLRRATFRPRISDGNVISTENLELQVFQ